jgi:hypothetical protein
VRNICPRLSFTRIQADTHTRIKSSKGKTEVDICPVDFLKRLISKSKENETEEVTTHLQESSDEEMTQCEQEEKSETE